jgi:dual specificity phosphatase 12
MGKSRSTTLIIAYLLSKDPSLTPQAALDSVRTVREIAEPNEGFMKQLELYHSMGCPVDVTIVPAYQRWLYQQDVQASIAINRAPDNIHFSDEVDKENTNVKADLEYRCRKCRRGLATSSYLPEHIPKQSHGTKNKYAPISTIGPESVILAQCSHIFIDPLSWMRPELEQGKLEGRLECPNEKCKTNVGKYAWQGMQCSCGGWVVPAISLARGRVDEIKSRIGGGPGALGGKI